MCILFKCIVIFIDVNYFIEYFKKINAREFKSYEEHFQTKSELSQKP